jgi:hypothetical protein
MSIELVPLCTATAHLATPFILPDTPMGTRVIAEVESFEFEGERLRAHSVGKGGADWLTLSPAGLGTVDVRTLLETHDGALVYVSYRGRLDLSGGPGASPSYAAPLFDTGDERYAWLNAIQAIAKGTISEGGARLVYEVHEVR